MVNNYKNNPLLQGMNYLAQLFDVLGVGLLFVTIHRIYLGSFTLMPEYINALLISLFLTFVIFQKMGIYTSWRGKSKFSRFRVIFVSWSFVVILMMIAAALTKGTADYSRVWFFSWAMASFVYLTVYRQVLDLVLSYSRRQGWNHKGIIIFGAGELGQKVAGRLEEADWVGFKVLSFFDDQSNIAETTINGVAVKETSQLITFLSDNDVKELWIALPFKDEERVKKLIYELRHISISIKFIPDIFGFRLLNQDVYEVAGIPVVQLNGTPMQGVNRLVKELEDRFLSLIIILLISPVMLIIAILIKLESKGPILFKQIRNGWDGKEIKVYKFRSMGVDAEKEGFKQATKNDNRITKLGAFLRKTSLDELPQFFNVLQGRMSIVGPRPHVVSQNEAYKDQVDYYMQRHRVKPGITGWAQINGFRGETDTLEKMSKRVEFDLYYIENWSLWFDIKIIMMTIAKGFINKNAY
jgi:putative colanic acid biosynthesis UDP-glucose lipid carrier transferase